MAPILTSIRLLNLPSEIELSVTKYLTHPDLKHLSSTCQFYRRLLVPRIFESVKLREHAGSGATVQALIGAGYAEHVRKLRFVAYADEGGGEDREDIGEARDREDASGDKKDGKANGDAEANDAMNTSKDGVDGGSGEDSSVNEAAHNPEETNEEQDEGERDGANSEAEEREDEESGKADGEEQHGDKDNDEEVEDAVELLSTESSNILSHLSRFPNLHTLTVSFDFDIQNWEESIHIFIDEESPAERRKAERKDAWRKLMLRTFESLARNDFVTFSNLDLINLPPAIVSFYDSRELNNFFGQIRQFKLNLFGGDNGAGWNLNTQPGWQQFASELGSYFFDHLTSVESVILEAHDSSPLGLEGMNHAPLPFGKYQMPHLRSLYLEHCFVDPNLVIILTGQLEAGLLEELHLRNCYSSSVDNTLAENGISWAEFFRALSATKSRSLRMLEVTNENKGDDEESKYIGGMGIVAYNENEESEEIREVRAILEDQGKHGRRLFAHVSLDDKYGMLFTCEQDNRAKFLEGKDQKAYDDLMAMVVKNVSRRS